MKPPQNLETNRLLLRQPGPDDSLPIFQTYAQDPEVTKYLIWQPHASLQETEDFLKRCISVWSDGSAYPWVILKKQDGQLIGMVETRIDDYKADLGYVLAKSEWGKGYMQEAVETIIEWLLSQDRLYRVWAVCDVENKGSARVLEKAGLQREGVLRRWIVHPNISAEPRDCYCYARVK